MTTDKANITASFAADLSANGYFICSELLGYEEVERLSSAVSSNRSLDHPGDRAQTYAIRNLLKNNTEVQELAACDHVMNLVRSVLGSSARAVKATFFDKTPGANWKVPPHQDVTVTVQERIDTPGFGPWTEKAGIQNVQPPTEILEQMLALRFHLDDCDEDNGALKVWPGSHAAGRLKDAGITDWTASNNNVMCPVPSGGVMFMRPLLIHASSPATSPSHRRVVHIEYAGCDLPNGLKWQTEIF